MKGVSRERLKTHWPLLLVPTVVAPLLLGLLVLLGWVVQPPPRSAPIAGLNLISGQPFEFQFSAAGEEYRIFMDMQCDQCALPIEGHLEMAATGRVVKAIEISVGDREFLGTRSKSYQAHPITSVPKQPAGTQITVRGQLTIPAARGKDGAPSPSVRLFRLSVTR